MIFVRLIKFEKLLGVMELMVSAGNLQQTLIPMERFMHIGLNPNVFTYSFNEMTKEGLTPYSHRYSSLIRALCMEGMLDEAIEIFEVIEENDYRCL